MKHLFVPYELAKKLKEKGFDEPSIFGQGYFEEELTTFHEGEDIGEFRNSDDCEDWITAPLYQQVIDWFREKHKMRISDFTDSGESLVTGFVIFNRDKNTRAFLETRVSGMNYYESLNKAIEQALNLI